MAGIAKAHPSFESVLQFAKVRLLPAGAQRRISRFLGGFILSKVQGARDGNKESNHKIHERAKMTVDSI